MLWQELRPEIEKPLKPNSLPETAQGLGGGKQPCPPLEYLTRKSSNFNRNYTKRLILYLGLLDRPAGTGLKKPWSKKENIPGACQKEGKKVDSIGSVKDNVNKILVGYWISTKHKRRKVRSVRRPPPRLQCNTRPVSLSAGKSINNITHSWVIENRENREENWYHQGEFQREEGGRMGIIRIDEVVGITDHTGRVKCRDCMKDEDWRQIRSEDQVITEEKKDEKVTSDDEIINRYNRICFCDYCKKRMIPPLT
jgi:hypothetical protein